MRFPDYATDSCAVRRPLKLKTNQRLSHKLPATTAGRDAFRRSKVNSLGDSGEFARWRLLWTGLLGRFSKGADGRIWRKPHVKPDWKTRGVCAFAGTLGTVQHFFNASARQLASARPRENFQYVCGRPYPPYQRCSPILSLVTVSARRTSGAGNGDIRDLINQR